MAKRPGKTGTSPTCDFNNLPGPPRIVKNRPVVEVYGFPNLNDTATYSPLLTSIHPNFPELVRNRHSVWVDANRNLEAHTHKAKMRPNLPMDPNKLYEQYDGRYTHVVQFDRSTSPTGRSMGPGEIMSYYKNNYCGDRTGVMLHVQRQTFSNEAEFKQFVEEDNARLGNKGKSQLDGVPWAGAGRYITNAVTVENRSGDYENGLGKLQMRVVDANAYLRAQTVEAREKALKHFNPESIGLPQDLAAQVATNARGDLDVSIKDYVPGAASNFLYRSTMGWMDTPDRQPMRPSQQPVHRLQW